MLWEIITILELVIDFPQVGLVLVLENILGNVKILVLALDKNIFNSLLDRILKRRDFIQIKQWYHQSLKI